MKKYLKKFWVAFIIVFLPIFMFGVFGPTEVFFANYSEFGFLYRDFGVKFLLMGILISLLLGALLAFIPWKFRKPILIFIWAFSIAGYIQTMFLNTHLNQIGVSAEKYSAATDVLIKNSIFWVVTLIIAYVLIYRVKKYGKKIMLFSSLFLLAIQLVGYSSLFLTADKAAFEYEKTEYCLSSQKQYTLSSKNNVILFVLDNFSNIFYDWGVEEYPELANQLNDFTYYNNTNCNYHGTYPSLAHLLAGNELDTNLTTTDWLYSCWNNEVTDEFYDMLHEKNYTVNLYTPLTDLLTGTNTLEIMQDKIDNINYTSQIREVNHSLLDKTLLQMSCYRFLPELFKTNFDVNNEQYESIVRYPDNEIMYSNPNFYNGLLENGLTLDNSSNYFTIQHLNGTHEILTDANCQYDYENTSYEATVKGIFVMLEEYINQLKAQGIYDNATIIITADHGNESNSEVVFFIKEPGESHDQMQITNAPISLDELVPTIAYEVGDDYSKYGLSIHDFYQDQIIERKVYLRAFDNAYPAVKKFDSDAQGGANSYHVYTYSGGRDELYAQYANYSFTVVPILDSYF